MKSIKRLGEYVVSEKQNKIFRGVSYRSSQLCFFFSIAFTVYGFTSLEFIKKFDPSVTLVNNILPRFVFNGIPYLMLGVYCRSKTANAKVQSWLATIGIPLLFTIACFINVGPIIFNGNPQLYLYVHSANIFIIAATIITTSAPIELMLTQIFCFVIMFVVPLSYMLYKTDILILKTFINDLIFMFSISSLSAYFVHKLRVKLLDLDEKIKQEVSSFLGKPLAQSIYSASLKPFESKTHHGVVLSLDLRGFTKLKKTLEKDQFRTFIKAYHRLVSMKVGTMGGYLLKSMGDGHLIFFGNFDEETLEDIKDFAHEEMLARKRALATFSKNAFECASEIISEFQNYINSLDFSACIAIGAAIDCGEIETMIIGDDQHRREFDMTGDALLRCVRLEAFSKVLNRNNVEDSYLIVSPYCEDIFKTISNLIKFETTETDKKIRDFPEVDFIYFKKFEFLPKRQNFSA